MVPFLFVVLLKVPPGQHLAVTSLYSLAGIVRSGEFATILDGNVMFSDDAEGGASKDAAGLQLRVFVASSGKRSSRANQHVPRRLTSSDQVAVHRSVFSSLMHYCRLR